MKKIIQWIKKIIKGRDCCEWLFCTNEVAGHVQITAGIRGEIIGSFCNEHKDEAIRIAEEALKPHLDKWKHKN
jgi:hypothetical protein